MKFLQKSLTAQFYEALRPFSTNLSSYLESFRLPHAFVLGTNSAIAFINQVGNICRPEDCCDTGRFFWTIPDDVMRTAVSALKKFFLKDTTLIFLGAALLSSYSTVVALLYHDTNGFTPPATRVAFGSPSVRSPLDLSRSFHGQVSFVSGIIKSHAPKLPNYDQLARLIVEESAKASIDPLFVAAVIRSESMFQSAAVSNRGAQGLMQIMPETGRYISQRANVRWGGSQSLSDPSTNIRLGIAYLKYLEGMFKGNRERILIAYNWGPANLNQSLRYKTTPPRQSVNYAREILKHHKQWKSSLQQVAYEASPLQSVRAMVG